MDSDLDHDGNTTVTQLLKQMRMLNIRFPKVIVNFFLNILNVSDLQDADCEHEFVKKMKLANIRPSDKLSFSKLQSFHHIFNRCPMSTAQTNNNSQNFKDAISSNFAAFNPVKKGYGIEEPPANPPPTVFDSYSKEEKKHVQSLLRQIHTRIEEKFKDYRRAFRHFDVNFDGKLTFQEFIAGCEFSGIHMSIKDFK